MTVNQTFRFWERCNARVNLVIPGLYLKYEPEHGDPMILCSSKNIKVHQDSTSISIALKTQ